MKTLLSLPYFAASLMAPLFDVPDVYDDTQHPYHNSLIEDIHSITTQDLDTFLLAYPYMLSMVEEDQNKEERLKLKFITVELETQIGILRKELLLESQLLPKPYDHLELKDIIPDKDGLVYMNQLSGYGGGFYVGNEVFTICPSTDVGNSSYWLLQQLYNSELKNRVKIRLDPLVHHPKESFSSMGYRMQVYGKVLDWERIKNLKSIEQLEFIPDYPERSDILKTEIIWRPSGNQIHFTCEELPKQSNLNRRGSRYFHAILEKSSGEVEHCDGAIRFYNNDQYNERLQNHIKANEVTKAGTRIKVFHVTNPSHQLLINLITSFFVWNQDILKYFNPNLSI